MVRTYTKNEADDTTKLPKQEKVRRRGRPRTRWQHFVMIDLEDGKDGICKKNVKDRQLWEKIIKQCDKRA